MTTNLTELGIPDDMSVERQEDHRAMTNTARVTAIFRNHRQELIRLIQEAAQEERTSCFGAIAWLTDMEILQALRGLTCAMIVQKEDFLRPDTMPEQPDWPDKLRAAYQALREPAERYMMPGVAKGLSTSGDPSVEPVRCVGERPERGRINPKMHNKFLVFAKSRNTIRIEKYGEYAYEIPEVEWEPYAVWTGSFNFTEAAHNSWENSVYIESEEIAQSYLNEWAQLLAFSEPLDWTSEYVEPEWRIGT